MGKFVADKKVQDIIVLSFSFHEINLEEREVLKKELNGFLDGENKKFVINLSEVGFLSSLVIATIVFFAKEIRAAGGQVKLSNLSNEAQGIMQITRLDQIFEEYPTEEEAISAF